jgi:TRAP-type C4-dicarboxylate transport system permease small subunit
MAIRFDEFINDFTKTLILFAIGALAFTVALAWNETVLKFFQTFGINNGTLLSSFLYTVLVTVASIAIIFFLQRYRKLLKEKVTKAKKKEFDLDVFAEDDIRKGIERTFPITGRLPENFNLSINNLE